MADTCDIGPKFHCRSNLPQIFWFCSDTWQLLATFFNIHLGDHNSVPVCLYVYFKSDSTFTKFGMNTMPLQDVPKTYYLIPCNQ